MVKTSVINENLLKGGAIQHCCCMGQMGLKSENEKKGV